MTFLFSRVQFSNSVSSDLTLVWVDSWFVDFYIGTEVSHEDDFSFFFSLLTFLGCNLRELSVSFFIATFFLCSIEHPCKSFVVLGHGLRGHLQLCSCV